MSDLAIERVETAILDVPLVRPHRFAANGHGRATDPARHRHHRAAVSPASARASSPAARGGAASRWRRCSSSSSGISPRCCSAGGSTTLPASSRRSNDVVNSNLYAKAAVEVALHDAWSRSLGVPVHTLLGGLARTSVPVTWALGTESAAEVIEEALGKLEAGLHYELQAEDGCPGAGRRRRPRDRGRAEARRRRQRPRRHQRPLGPAHLAAGATAAGRGRCRPDRAAGARSRGRVARRDQRRVADPGHGRREPAHAVGRTAAGRTLRAADVFSLKTTKSGGLRYNRAIAEIAAAGGVPCHGGTAIDGPSARLRRCTWPARCPASPTAPNCSGRC